MNMKFKDVVEHLARRGFATRARWNRRGNRTAVVWTMDNTSWSVTDSPKAQDLGGGARLWHPCLSDLLADDWEILDCFWRGPEDWDAPFRDSTTRDHNGAKKALAKPRADSSSEGAEPSGDPLFLPKSPGKCAKCGSSDTAVAWHATDHDCSWSDKRRGIAREDEHLHYTCRGCGYSWTGDTRDRGAKT